MYKRSILFLSTFLLSNISLYAFDSIETEAHHTVKSSIKSNGIVVHSQPQVKTDDFLEMFTEGDFYARLRNNNFLFTTYGGATENTQTAIAAIGASLVYKSANYYGFDMTAGGYLAQSFFDKDNLLSLGVKGKDTFSRYNYVNDGDTYMAVIGQLNLGYSFAESKIVLGRQLLETFYTRSNDTKMIPNAFDGVSIQSKDIPGTAFTLAYLDKQKLRDHTSSHSVLMYGDANSSSSTLAKASGNDDSVMHRGLTYSALKAAGKPTDSPLIVLDAQNKSLENLKINFASYIVSELISQVVGELNYKVNFDGFSVTPGFRYLQQFDNGAGKVGGAALIAKNSAIGYKNPNSLDGKMIAARVVTKFSDYKINLAYTGILDEGDLVTPWRGFPTSGYTRSMGIYNWRANTNSYRIELVKAATDTGVYTTPFIQTSILYMQTDEDKLILDDSMFYYFGLVQNIPAFPEFQYRFRLGYRDFIQASYQVPDYLDSRLEFNYLF